MRLIGELCELQADRSMIHHLLEEELKTMDDMSEFNYIHFMERYNLKPSLTKRW